MEQETTLQPKDPNEKAIEVEEGEVGDSKHKSASKSKVILLSKLNPQNSKENGDNDKDGDKEAKNKKHKKEKKHKHSEKESSRKDRDDSEERHKKKKESKSKNKKSDRKDRRSSSRSESPKKKHRSSPSFSKKSKSNRKKSVSPSNSRSRSKSKYESRHKNRSRTPDKKRSRRERSDSRNRRRNSPRRHDRRSPVRSPGRNDRRRERSPVKQRDDRDKKRDEEKRKVVEEPKKNDLEERIKATMESEPVDDEASQRLEMAFAAAEEDEERLARERREQRRKLLEQFAKANDQAEAQKQKTAVEEKQEALAKEVKNTAPVVTEEPKKMVEEVAPVVEKKEEAKKVSVVEEEGRIEEEKEDEDDGKEEAKEDGVKKLSMMVQNNHNMEKEKKLRLIESMREQLQKEEEALNEEREEEERRNKKKQEEDAAKKKDQEFDMFAETPETLEAEKVSRPTQNVGGESYDDDQGYYRGQIGELIQERYQITAKLGKGVFGNVFKGIDTQTNQEVAIKVVKSDEIYTISGLKEREILTMLNTADKHNKRHVIRLLDSFEYRKHLVLVFELMEMDLRGAIKTFGKKLGLSIESVRSYARQLFIALSHLRKHKIIHADLKPDNILVTNGQKTLKLGDFGSAFTIEENTITPYLVARYYRAPEIMLGCAYDTAVDMWSAACTIFELYTGKILFSGRDNNEMLKMIIQTKGRFNNKMLKRGEFSRQYFDNHHNFLSTEIDPVTREKYVKPIPIGNKITRDIGTLLNAVEIELNDDERKKLAQLKELLERCLTLDPNKRLTPDEALQHPFIDYGMKKIALDSSSVKHAF